MAEPIVRNGLTGAFGAPAGAAGLDGARPASRALLEELPMLRLLPPDVRSLVMESFVPATYEFGDTIVRSGEPADALYVLVAGRARILHVADTGEEISLGALRPGDVFGETALLERSARTATVRASSDVEVLRLDRTVFDALVRSRPEIRDWLDLQTRHRHLHNFLRRFTAFARLPTAALRLMVTELERVSVEPGTVVIRQGDPPGGMYVVEEGHLRTSVEDDGHRRYLAYLRTGDFFGELSLFADAPRSATVEAVAPCTLLQLTADTYQRLLAQYPEFRERIAERVRQYDYRHTARVPIDFADELLPADTSVFEKVGPDQVEYTIEMPVAGDRGKRIRDDEGVAGDGKGPDAPPPQPFATADGKFVRRAKRIRRFRHVRQIDEMDCGAAALAMVCQHFGRTTSLARIRQLVHTSIDGTSMRAITRAGSELGLAARAVKASPIHLGQMPLPAIAHWQGNHWVVLYDTGPTHVKIADPAAGLRRLPRAEFEAKWSGYAALFDHALDVPLPPARPAPRTWMFPLLRPHARLALQATALALIVSALTMVLPIFTQVVVDRVLVDQDVGLLRVMIGAMLAVMLFMAAALLVQRYLLSFIAVRIDSAALDFLTRRLLSLPMSYFNTRRTGDIQRRLAGLRQVRIFFVEHGVVALTSVAQLSAALLLMTIYSATLTLVFLAVVPIYVLLMRFSAAKLRPMYDALEEADGRYHSHQIDAIKGIETVKAMGAEGAFREIMLAQFNSVARRRFRADFTAMSYDGSIGVVTFLSVVLFLWAGAHQVMQGQMTIGALVAFNSLVAIANAPIVLLLRLWDNVQIARVLLSRLDDVLEQEPEQGTDRSRLHAVRTLEGRITLRGVGFRYGGPESPRILEGITVDIAPNTRVAIVGRSGSGKTTLIKLLSGLVEPTDGTILYDSVDLRTLNYRDLRRNIGFVLQENHLFDDTIARNIAFGDAEPDMDAVLWAARAANAHEFIDRLPLGYETRIGESGLGLSGGQRQRIAIARALYHRPPVLMFDEATSALDTESERAVKENMDRLLEGRTSFIIAHRLSTVRGADLILVLEQGRLAEQGTHDQLMQRQGLYFYLVSQQLEL
ncbi:MAG TPA: peptidase domain-containing ABC transporter [Gemmatimonadaceae bacterium]|nr:peptidase domain-containing ABC transporter [Gemmatimonadaceae bacterium]